ncbi:hypothetical protein BRARA_I01878 [Brassica rapa]|uniref:ADP-ribosyl cyclase/cyclic ADP-ribose hydrolase n=1 Tax=Brassica campestris TaxID=3711 RepID=A0A397Y2S7_BRACM|nr:hypothetical protein BRARA_I01878 [Brassica rapa]
MAASSNPTVDEQPPQHQAEPCLKVFEKGICVFISFRGTDLRRRFVSHLVTALKLNNINVFIDDYEDRGQPLETLLQRIEESTIALAIFSGKYTESAWCVRELAKIKACRDEGTLVAIPIFYKLEPSTVRDLKGSFGDRFRSLAKGDERKKEWKEAFSSIPNIMGITIDKKRTELREVSILLNSVESDKVIEIVKAVKTVLNNVSSEGNYNALVNPSENISAGTSSGGEKHKTFGMDKRLKELEDKLDRDKYKGTRIIGVVGMPGIGKTTLLKELYKTWQCRFSRHALLDKIHEKIRHVEELECLPNMLVAELLKSNNTHIDHVKDPYSQLQERKVLVVLDDVTKKEQIDSLRGILQWIKEGSKGSRVVIATSDMSLINDFVDDSYMSLIKEIWIIGKAKLKILAESHSPTKIGSVFKVSYDELCSEQKDAFLDIACFRSEELDYVESLLASSDPGSAEAMSPVKALTNKFLINTCDGRVGMHDLLYTYSRELDSKGAGNVRGIFLDLCEVKGEMSLDKDYFTNMGNLRYLKFYNSHCPQECKTNNKINIPDGLNLPLKKIRCLHWLKFPLEELPNDFNPLNLVDLKLPYSEIQRLWEGDKDTSSLKWVDLNHSSKLCSLSELSKAQNLQRLNLEECTALKLLPSDMKNMKRLAFLNLKGCTSLESLPEMNLISLKTLTLSGCSNFKEFLLVSENIETLYLDGTSITEHPTNMEKLQRLVVLNMKNCQNLEKIPVLYLCLSRNDEIKCLPAGISQLSQLKWLDLKYCTSLTSLPEFPPNLRFLDAHGCSSLKTVSTPLARIMPTEQNHSTTFIFTNCENLQQAAKEEISSYAQRKCQLLSYASKRYNGGLVSEALFSTCFPGCEVPSWFCYETVGSELEVKLLPHWHDKRLAGIALCAVVSFNDCHDQISRLSVTCNFKVKVEDKSWVPFTCPVGSWTRQGDKIESDHVFIGYTSCPCTIKSPEDENSDKCSSTEASLEFTVAGGTNEKGKLKVLKCGLGLVYAKDKSKNSCHEAKYDMPVGASFQEISEEVDGGGGKKKKKTRGDDGRPKKKKINIPCQSNSDARRKDSSVVRHVENLQAADESVPS